MTGQEEIGSGCARGVQAGQEEEFLPGKSLRSLPT